MVLFGGLFGSRFSSGFLFARSMRNRKRKVSTATAPIPPAAVRGGEEADEDVKTEEGSFYSLTTDILPPFGAQSNRRVRLRRFVISPYDTRYRFSSSFPLPPSLPPPKVLIFFTLHFVNWFIFGDRCFNSCIYLLISMELKKQLTTFFCVCVWLWPVWYSCYF